MKVTTATKNGVEQYVIGRSGRKSGNNRPWIGKTWSPTEPLNSEICAAHVWRDDGGTDRWAVVEREATPLEADGLRD